MYVAGDSHDARRSDFKTLRQDITTHAADGNLWLVNLGRREARPARRDEDKPAACGIAAAMQSQTQSTLNVRWVQSEIAIRNRNSNQIQKRDATPPKRTLDRAVSVYRSVEAIPGVRASTSWPRDTLFAAAVLEIASVLCVRSPAQKITSNGACPPTPRIRSPAASISTRSTFSSLVRLSWPRASMA